MSFESSKTPVLSSHPDRVQSFHLYAGRVSNDNRQTGFHQAANLKPGDTTGFDHRIVRQAVHKLHGEVFRIPRIFGQSSIPVTFAK